MEEIPVHLRQYTWYAPHQAWLASKGHEPRHDHGDAELSDAWLSGAELSGVDLSGVDLSGVDLSGAKLTGAILDRMYVDIPVTLAEVRDAILANLDKFNMRQWHSDNNWHNGKVHPLSECATTHCIAGWAHYLAAQRRPELCNPKVSTYLVGRLALGEEATKHFFDKSDDALAWLKSLV